VRKEKRVCALVLAHLADVLDIVTTDAPDATNRKDLVGPRDRDRGLGRGRNDVAAIGHVYWPLDFLADGGCPAARDGCRVKDGCAYQGKGAAANRAGLRGPHGAD